MTPHVLAWYFVVGLATALVAVPAIPLGLFARSSRLHFVAAVLMVPFTLFMLHLTFVVGGPAGLR